LFSVHDSDELVELPFRGRGLGYLVQKEYRAITVGQVPHHAAVLPADMGHPHPVMA